MVDVLLLCRDISPARVELAARGALTAGASDGRAVQLLAQRSERPEAARIELEPRLAQIGTGQPSLNDYEQLLSAGGSQ